jgi:hypothetical protein
MRTDCDLCIHEDVCKCADCFDEICEEYLEISKICADHTTGLDVDFNTIKESDKRTPKANYWVKYSFCPNCGHRINWAEL